MKRAFAPLFAAALLYAGVRQLSPIPVPTWQIVDLDPTTYDEWMLREALDRGEIFTFLAKSAHTKDEELLSLRRRYLATLHIGGRGGSGRSFRVAFVVPEKRIGKYAQSTTLSALAYLIGREGPFEMEVFPAGDENNETLDAVTSEVKRGAFDLVVAPVTRKGAAYLCERLANERVYVPTLHRDRVECDNPDFTFGGIDYRYQVETLSCLVESNTTVVTVSDGSGLSKMLDSLVVEYVDINDSLLLGNGSYYKELIERHEDLNQSTIFLNTPVVKSSLFLTQMTLADYRPVRVLSTQLNYSPLLLTLTQYHDRENMVVASAIGSFDPAIAETVALLGHDIRFNWLNYATLVGLDMEYAFDAGADRLSTETVVEGSVRYGLSLYDAGLYRFVPRPLPEPPVPLESNETAVPDELALPDAVESPEDEPSVYPSEDSFSQTQSSE